MKWLDNIKRRSEGTTWGNRAVIWFSVAAIWLVFGTILAATAAPKTWRGAALIVAVGPPLYFFGEFLVQCFQYLWTDDKDDGESEGLATIKRLWRFTLAVAGTCALIAVFYFVTQWVQMH